MTEKQIDAKLNKIATLCNELHDEAKRRFGDKGSLFFEAEGYFMLMEGDPEDSRKGDRNEAIRFISRIPCKLGAGAF